ncbi:hypothetical protein MXD59_21700 [Frankia sp. Ag45/Mut15]|uniref:Uncharacterized protein n=1 Tax=Frankia umida TaxID=573489 RepID=A0ABT0K487_9ACTN|nr:hypothetical protein [Frankia umida]MCK9878352.1 hypothetical protein [Frankia umida]
MSTVSSPAGRLPAPAGHRHLRQAHRHLIRRLQIDLLRSSSALCPRLSQGAAWRRRVSHRHHQFV